MHAKMTRDRKKCFVASLNRVISRLEGQNRELRGLLVKNQEVSDSDSVNETKPCKSIRLLDERKPQAVTNDNLEKPSESLASLPNNLEVVQNQAALSVDPSKEATSNDGNTVPNLHKSSTVFMSISNSRIFTVG